MPVVAPRSITSLKRQKRWVCWQVKDGKKIPISPATGLNASPTNPDTWATYEEANTFLKEHLTPQGKPCGLNVALNGDGLIGIDLDDCRNAKNKKISGWARKIIERFAAYTESSPSGTGIRIFVRGKLPPSGRKKGKTEVYANKKFLSFTGRQITSHGAGENIESRGDELMKWHAEVFGSDSPTRKNSERLIIDESADIENDPIVKRMFRRFPESGTIYRGEQNGKYTSQSDAEMALANFGANTGLDDQTLCNVLVGARLNAGEEPKHNGYYRLTIDKARIPKGAENRKTDRGGAGAGGADEKGADDEQSEVTPIKIEEARKVFQKYLYLPDPYIVDVVLAVVAGTKILDTDPLWMFLKGPPGGGKTELLNAVYDHNLTVCVSTLTPAALISGFRDPDNPDAEFSLADQLDGKTLVIKDFTTLLSGHPAARDEIFGILRDMYDGRASKAFGTGKKEFEGKFNILAGTTSAIDQVWHLSTLGARFLEYNLTIDRKEQTRRAMAGANNEKEMRESLANAAAGVLAGIPDYVPTIPEAIQEKTLILADLLARCRTYIHRDRNDVVHTAPEVEVPTRIVKQLLRLGQSLALVRHKQELTEKEFDTMRKVAFDSMPSARRTLVKSLLSVKVSKEAKYYAKECTISESVIKRHINDLHLLGIVDESEMTGKFHHKKIFKMSDEAREEFTTVGF